RQAGPQIGRLVIPGGASLFAFRVSVGDLFCVDGPMDTTMRTPCPTAARAVRAFCASDDVTAAEFTRWTHPRFHPDAAAGQHLETFVGRDISQPTDPEQLPPGARDNGLRGITGRRANRPRAPSISQSRYPGPVRQGRQRARSLSGITADVGESA